MKADDKGVCAKAFHHHHLVMGIFELVRFGLLWANLVDLVIRATRQFHLLRAAKYRVAFKTI